MIYNWFTINLCTKERLVAKGLNNLSCAPKKEMEDVLSHSYMILNIMSEYFNSTRFDENPISRDSSILYFNFGMN
jgi:hypothetical protein